jgi:hypothetical protein
MGVLKVGDMVLCDNCRELESNRFDFNKRCCFSRHLLSMPREFRVEQYKAIEIRKGREYMESIINDVNRLYAYKQGLEKEKANG